MILRLVFIFLGLLALRTGIDVFDISTLHKMPLIPSSNGGDKQDLNWPNLNVWTPEYVCEYQLQASGIIVQYDHIPGQYGAPALQ